MTDIAKTQPHGSDSEKEDPLEYGSENSQISKDEDVDAVEQFEEEFGEIKELTLNTIRDNIKRTTAIADWKNETRSLVLEVKRQFNEWIDQFASRYLRSVNAQQEKRAPNFLAEDTKSKRVLQAMRSKYGEIAKIYSIVGRATEEEKLRTMECMYPQMRKIRMSVLKKDAALKQAAATNQALMLEIANLETLAATI